MGVSSFLRKNKQESVLDDGGVPARAEEEKSAPRARRKRKQGAAEEPVDPVLPEKKRARRRLVGAIALVLAAVIGLPMILDSEPKPLGEDIAIQIPSKDQPVAAENHAASDKQAAGGKVPAISSLDKHEEIVRPAAIAEAPKTAAALPPSSDSPAKKAEPAGQRQPDKDDSKHSEHMVAKAKADDSARARALLAGAPEPERQEVRAEKSKTSFEKKNEKNGRYLIQVAALASQDKVSQLQGRLKSAGIKSHTQKIATQSGDRIRIRVGPFASKEEAEKTRAKLAKMGLGGTLIPA